MLCLEAYLLDYMLSLNPSHPIIIQRPISNDHVTALSTRVQGIQVHKIHYIRVLDSAIHDFIGAKLAGTF